MRKALIVSMLDQAALSAFNFLLALMLIKYWSDTPGIFGAYAVVIAGCLTLVSVQNALVNGHLTVLRPKARDAEDEAALLSMFWSVNVVATVGAVVVAFGVAMVAFEGAHASLSLAVAFYVGAVLVWEYLRCYYFSSLEVVSLLALDALSLTLSAIAIAAVWFYRPPLTLDALFLILASGQVLASVIAVVPHRRHFRFSLGQDARRAYLTVWREQSRWALLGVITAEFQQRGYVFVVALVFGAANVALLQAGALLFRPVQLLTHAWGKLARVILAGHFADGRHDEGRAFTLKSLGWLAMVFFAFLGTLWLAWPFVRTHMFQGQFADVASVVVLWSIASGVIIATGVFNVEAQSLIKFRELSYASILGALGCGAVLALVVAVGDFRGSILAVLAGQLVSLFVILRILRASDRSVARSIAGAQGVGEVGEGGLAAEAAALPVLATTRGGHGR